MIVTGKANFAGLKERSFKRDDKEQSYKVLNLIDEEGDMFSINVYENNENYKHIDEIPRFKEIEFNLDLKQNKAGAVTKTLIDFV